jgi:Flp pilus assembly protein TadG
MRRLTSAVLQRLLPHRLAEERGATAVMVVLLLPALLGGAALAVDVGRYHADLTRMRTAADAAALAVAADCGRGNCGDMNATASGMATANAGGIASLGTAVSVSGNQVTVTVTGQRPHAFAPLIGVTSSPLRVRSVATFTAAAPLRVPVGMSWCEYQAQRNQEAAHLRDRDHNLDWFTTSATTCTGPDGTTVRGGRSRLQPASSTTCPVAPAGGTVTRADAATAGRINTVCFGNAYKPSIVGQIWRVPVWDRATTSGTTTTYRVVGYAEVRVRDIGSTDHSNPDEYTLDGQVFSGLQSTPGTATGPPVVTLVREP